MLYVCPIAEVGWFDFDRRAGDVCCAGDGVRWRERRNSARGGLNHAAMDGISFFRFMEMWATSAVAASSHGHGTELKPLHDRMLVHFFFLEMCRLVHFDGDEELASRLSRQVAPDLPRVSSRLNQTYCIYIYIY